jgi:hypothetical protein
MIRNLDQQVAAGPSTSAVVLQLSAAAVLQAETSSAPFTLTVKGLSKATTPRTISVYASRLPFAGPSNAVASRDGLPSRPVCALLHAPMLNVVQHFSVVVAPHTRYLQIVLHGHIADGCALPRHEVQLSLTASSHEFGSPYATPTLLTDDDSSAHRRYSRHPPPVTTPLPPSTLPAAGHLHRDFQLHTTGQAPSGMWVHANAAATPVRAAIPTRAFHTTPSLNQPWSPAAAARSVATSSASKLWGSPIAPVSYDTSPPQQLAAAPTPPRPAAAFPSRDTYDHIAAVSYVNPPTPLASSSQRQDAQLPATFGMDINPRASEDDDVLRTLADEVRRLEDHAAALEARAWEVQREASRASMERSAPVTAAMSTALANHDAIVHSLREELNTWYLRLRDYPLRTPLS